MKKKTIICLALLLIAVIFFHEQIADLSRNIMAKIEEEKSIMSDLQYVAGKNADIYAWITVPGTSIDYPIAQSTTNDSFYLTHDIEKEENIYGAIYTERISNKDFMDPMTVVYGHNMRDGSMFGSLKNFMDKTMFSENDTIVVSLMTGEKLTYKIVAAYKYPAEHLPSTFDCSTEEKAEEYFAKIPELTKLSGGNFREDPALKAPIITLSTCTSNEAYRFLVQGVLSERKMEEK